MSWLNFLGGAVGSGGGDSSSSSYQYGNLLGTIGDWLWTSHHQDDARDFSERMSSTAHRREMFDLLKAGLNPVLAANGGASSPSSEVVPMSSLANSASKYQAMYLQNLQKDNIWASTQASMAAANNSQSQSNFTDHQNALLDEQIARAKYDVETARGTAKSIDLENSQKQIETDFLIKYPEVLKAKILGNALGSVVDPLRSIVPYRQRSITEGHRYDPNTGEISSSWKTKH